MKKNILIAAVAVFIITMTGVAFAASPTTATVNASATVAAKCQFTTSGSGISFGALDQETGIAVAGSIATQPAFWCTKGYAYTVTSDNGVNKSGTTYRLKSAGTILGVYDYIPYNFTFTATGTGTGKTGSLSPAMIATIDANSYDDVKADSYSDTITLTIAY